MRKQSNGKRLQLLPLLMYTKFCTYFFSNDEVYLNNPQFYISKGLNAHRSYISNNFNGALSEYKGVSHSEEIEYEELPDEVIERPLLEPFFTMGVTMLSRPDEFMLYGTLGVNFFSSSERLHPNLEIKLGLIGAKTCFNNNSANPNVSLGLFDCSLYTHHSALKDDYHKKRMDMLAFKPVEYNYLNNLAKTSISSARPNQLIQKNLSNNAPVRRIAIPMTRNSAITGSPTENPL